MLKEFKEFALKGNVVDMAVGIITGAALVDDIVMPPLVVITGGKSSAGGTGPAKAEKTAP